MSLEIAGNTIILSREEIETCAKNDGCVIFNQKDLNKAIKQAFDEGQAAAAKVAKKQRDMMCGKTVIWVDPAFY